MTTSTTDTTPGTADLAVVATRLGDDALVLGQRLCQWITRAPTVEEDLALANIALDLIGHARVLLSLAGELDGTARSEDDFAFARGDRDFTNALITELPGGDFGLTTARQLLYSTYAVLYYEALAACGHPGLAAFAHRAATEVRYHLRHAEGWTRRLGLGTAESRRRMQAGLDHLWPYTAELFEEDATLWRLAAAGTAPSPAPLRPLWQDRVSEVARRAGLDVPASTWRARGGRLGRHTQNFGPLIAELQSVHRQFPGGTW
ncbi:1,2-phenylacetyl-CoA epoxidase subunit PaaC [Streptomyces sp. NPDC051014]|uniref:1,2-phenylacetyl-CoA epoxidase subunit PaaC n=1 Tax=Streptomyces sp. NPDC051014 TaxID=3155751 RepID=UPI0033D5CA47